MNQIDAFIDEADRLCSRIMKLREQYRRDAEEITSLVQEANQSTEQTIAALREATAEIEKHRREDEGLVWGPCEASVSPPVDMTGEDAEQCGASGRYRSEQDAILCDRCAKGMA